MNSRIEQLVSSTAARNLSLFILRLVGGGLMIALHGWPKWESYADKVTKFPDPIGLGSSTSLSLTIFAELLCAGLLCIGYLTRFSAFICLFTMTIAAFIVHQDDPLNIQEKALLYFAIYGALLSHGPGSLSVDRLKSR